MARFSATVLPVTVMQSPCKSPASRSIFINGTMPPICTNSDIRYLPLGFKSAKTGTCFPISVKSSIFNATPAEWAIASRCMTALVEPPRAITTVIAFSNASRVIISSGRMFSFNKCKTAAPALLESAIFAGEIAACAELFGRLIPSASIAEAIVLAVYMPPQEPAPGMALISICSNSSREILPLA